MALGPPDIVSPLHASGVAARDDPRVSALAALLPDEPTVGDVAIGRLPCALPRCGAFPEGRMSARMIVLLAKALDTKAGERVVLRGDPMVTLGALLLSLPDDRRPESVVLETDDVARSKWTQTRLGDGAAALEIVGTGSKEHEPRPRDADRLLVYGPGRPAHHYRRRVRRPGQVVSVAADLRRPRWTQCIVDEDGGHTTLDLIEMRFQPNVGDADAIVRTARKALPLRRFLRLESMQGHVWRDLAPTRLQQNVARAVQDTFAGTSNEDDTPRDARLHVARRLFHLAYLDQACGSREGAEALYQASIAAAPSAEAWTFYGWVRSQAGDVDAALAACRAAIELDPGFGNAYNDLGAYMLAKGQARAAKSWFRKAIRAPRYAAPHYPYTNLGRLYLSEGDLDAARRAIEHALDMMPGYPPAERLLREIETRETKDPDQH